MRSLTFISIIISVLFGQFDNSGTSAANFLKIGVGGRVAIYWQPLAFGLVWGLSFATILTLFVTPAWLILPSRLKEIFSKFEIFSKKVNVQQQ